MPSHHSPSLPEAGSTYNIVHKDTGRIVTVKSGRVFLAVPDTMYGGVQWGCDKSETGWFGFCDVKSGNFLGYGEDYKLVAEAENMGRRESFVLRPRRSGGFTLCVLENQKMGAIRVKGQDDVVAGWEFYKVLG
ncbi:hypothetical protein F4808DRAFT_463800 [Astrocystis sublimbata]|nr:hypothetical protein F4808DRAFT_463800 [Astrocystis sublimbata]